MTYLVVRAFKPNGDMQIRLINKGLLEDQGLEDDPVTVKDYFPPRCEDFETVGEIEILGDESLMGDCYTLDSF